MCSLCIAFAQGATAPAALKVADCPAGNEYKVSVTGLAFYVIWYDKHYDDEPPSVAFPPFGALRHHLPSAERWDYKNLKVSLLIIDSTVLLYRWRQPPKGDCISSPVRAVVWFSPPKAA